MSYKLIISKATTLLQQVGEEAAQRVTIPIKNDFARSPKRDCFVLIPKEAQTKAQVCMTKLDASKQAAFSNIFKNIDLSEALTQFKQKDGTPRFDSFDTDQIKSFADTPEKTRLAIRLAQLEDKTGNPSLRTYDLRKILASANTPEKTLFKADLTEKLARMENINGNPKFSSADIELKVSLAETPEQADLIRFLTQMEDKNGKLMFDSPELRVIIPAADTPEKASLIKKMAQLEDIKGNLVFKSSTIKKIASTAEIPEKALSIANFTEKLAKLEDVAGNPRFDTDDIVEIVSSANTPEKIELAVNKEFLEKINVLDKSLGRALYFEQLKADTKIDIERMKKLYKFLNENKINLQEHGTSRLNSESIAKLFNSSMISAVDLIDDGVVKYAAELKYDNLQEFISNVSKLKTELDAESYLKLKENLSKLTTSDQKFEKMQCVMALNDAKLQKSTINKAIGLIKSPKTTVGQINSADEIFTSNKPYSEQTQEFLTKFNVPIEKKDKILAFLEKSKLNEKVVIDNKTKVKTLSKSVKQELAIQIEAHINIANNNIEFNNLLNSQLYKRLEIEPTPELLSKLNFDRQYTPALFSAVSRNEFSHEFTRLVNLVKTNPSKQLSELRESLPTNNITKELFKENGINYEKWIKTDETLVRPFSYESNYEESFKSVVQNIIDELNGNLFNSVDKTQTDKILKAIEDAGYKFGEETITKNGEAVVQKDLKKIIDVFKETINNNSEFWDKPLADIQKESSKNELIDHLLKGRKKDVADLASMSNSKMDLLVRLSDDDNIGRNLFLGNHVGCCTSINGGNDFAAPQHLMNSFVRAMEIVDKSGVSYGNSMCYFATVDNKLSFIIDSFETNAKLGKSQEITDAIIGYAKQVTREMGKADIPIYFGPNYNKIDMSKFQSTTNRTVGVIGSADADTYIDAVGGHRNINKVYSLLNLYELI